MKRINIVGKPRYENYGLTEKEYLTSSYNNDGKGLNGFHAQPDTGYRGCGQYRLAIRDRKITATVYLGVYGGGEYDLDELRKHGTVVRAEGSGTQFFLTDRAAQALIETKEYDVPAPGGDGNMGYTHHNIQINEE